MNITKMVARTYIKNSTSRDQQAVVTVPPSTFVDLSVLVLAFQSHTELSSQKEPGKNQNTVKGLSMIKRYSDEIMSGISGIFGPIAERNDSGSVRASIAKAIRHSSVTPSAVSDWSAAIREVMPWIKVRSDLFDSLFTSRSARAARELASVSEEQSPAAVLNKLAGIAPVSGLISIHRWVELVASEAGVPVSATESALTDAQVARDIGSDLSGVDASLSVVKPNTQESASLQEKKLELLSQLNQVANSSTNQAAVIAAAAQSKPTGSHATEVGRKIGLTADQEDAMMARGRVVIAAGAGSGKTRVLASKVAYHINELGVPSTAILATSFTRKASAELIKRCNDYGAVVGRSDDGFGTTHSIAGALLNKQAPGFKRPNYIGSTEGWKQTTLFRLAMEQVKMGPFGVDPPQPRGFWDARKPVQETIQPVPAVVQTPPQDDPVMMTEFVNTLRQAMSYLNWASRTWPGRKGMEAKEWLGFFSNLYDYGVPPSKMTPFQKDKFNEIVGKLTKGGQPITNFRVSKSNVVAGFDLYAVDDEPAAVLPTPRGKTNRMDDNVYFKTPARQWFNLGLKLETEDMKGNKTPIPMGVFRQVVSILKGKGVSASEAWHNGVDGYLDPEDDAVAVYGAYEWLKGPNGEPQFQNTGDLDDLLIDAVTALRNSPTVRQQVQSRFKVLLIDEAQDLNKTQHTMFGLMAGYLNPDDMKPWPDGRMTADTYSLIGDDKQAIYEFRGADPEEFISKSNMVEDGGDFTTKLLDTNFRSGEAIVQAANNLIAKNKRQVPMVCKANVSKNGQGRIVARPMNDVESAAVSVAEEISGTVGSASSGSIQYKDFGLALRSNAEAYQYGLEMLKLGIPFKSNARFFNDPNTKALIGWLTIANVGLDGPPDDIEEAIRDCTKAPFSKLGQTFFTRMEEKSKGSWAKWLVDDENWRRIYASGGKASQYYDALEHFVANLVAVSKMTGTPAEIVGRILELRGADGVSTTQAMFNNVTEDDDVMAELAAASEDGVVSQEQISEQAMSPINPLLSLVKGRDEIGTAVAYIKKLKNVNAKTTSSDTDKEVDRDAVTIGTMHSWKGLEVDTMYIPMVGGKFPRAGQDGSAPESPALASERRLAYVAITRAEQRAVILDIPNPKFGFSSQFIDEACVSRDVSREDLEDSGASKMASKWNNERIASMA